MPFPVLKQGDILIVSVQSALTDHDLLDLRDTLAERVGRVRARGVIIDVTAIDFCDIAMPGGMDGIALAEEARHIRLALPVVLTTGYSDAVGKNWAAACGFAIVSKPYKSAVLGQVMLSLIERGSTSA
ncbi:STAS domain-containing protein [Rhodopila globiformis]|uniref:Response regulatory domain-containing protein n=1 Tax=Rhodopila globiformis TaxID=1071 RepID=A0A2S6NAI1_RHOGL|nr:response regulator [Rhodopila globiformis]PPQ31619.1 hypothetical protein CCS01_17070 [Rhodopila globiformis]